MNCDSVNNLPIHLSIVFAQSAMATDKPVTIILVRKLKLLSQCMLACLQYDS